MHPTLLALTLTDGIVVAILVLAGNILTPIIQGLLNRGEANSKVRKNLAEAGRAEATEEIEMVRFHRTEWAQLSEMYQKLEKEHQKNLVIIQERDIELVKTRMERDNAKRDLNLIKLENNIE